MRKIGADESAKNTSAKKGCTCKKSNCLKKYCECYGKGEYCSPSCKCVECFNNCGLNRRAQVLADGTDPRDRG